MPSAMSAALPPQPANFAPFRCAAFATCWRAIRIADLVVDALALGGLRLHDGDILVVKHKIVSKAEGRMVALDSVKPSRQALAFCTQNSTDARVVELALREAKRVVRKKHVLITETQHGLVCANSGVDVSNVDGGKTAVLLPADADRSAAQIHRKLKKRTGLHIPVIIADSFGRAVARRLVRRRHRRGRDEGRFTIIAGSATLTATKCTPPKKRWPMNWRAWRGWFAGKMRAFRLV